MDIIKKSLYLIIDDSSVIQNAIRATLSRLGVPTNNITCCPTAGAAVGACKKQRFDVLFVDHNLGQGSTGLQMLEQLWQLKLVNDNTLVYIITGNETEAIALAYADYTPSFFMNKPIRPEEILRLVTQDLKKRLFATSMISAYTKNGLAGVKPLFFKAPNAEFLKEGMTKLGSRLILVKRYNEAKSVLNGLLSVHEHLEARIKLIELDILQEKYSEALSATDILLKKNENNLRLYDIKAELCIYNDDLNTAIRMWKKCIDLSEFSNKRYQLLIWCYLASGSNYDAYDLLVKSASQLPNSIWDGGGKRALAVWGDLNLADEERLEEWRADSSWQRISAKVRGRIKGIPSLGAQRALTSLWYLKFNRYGDANRTISDMSNEYIKDIESAFLVCRVYRTMGLNEELETLKTLWEEQLESTPNLLTRLQLKALNKR
ncbi:response regulator [Vibrio sp. Of7-15]|uniref:response regulator n=1 Tax=Vibrio sp. Of7-15 TaxID=2724879 RepID=UPI001EF30057|nr:response regulator [Vibrio sp. Of7-15]MCG7495890.1 response regulator [Vibrio sp. Of7-15]